MMAPMQISHGKMTVPTATASTATASPTTADTTTLNTKTATMLETASMTLVKATDA